MVASLSVLALALLCASTGNAQPVKGACFERGEPCSARSLVQRTLKTKDVRVAEDKELSVAEGAEAEQPEPKPKPLEDAKMPGQNTSLSQWWWMPDPTPRPTPPPTPQPTRGWAPCEDKPFKDKNGNTCGDYKDSLNACTGSGPIWTTDHFQMFKNSQGKSADAECCACGGGTRGSCKDEEGHFGWRWEDSSGHGCGDYTGSLNACTGQGLRTPEWTVEKLREFGGKRKRDGSGYGPGADAACCGCGGGSTSGSGNFYGSRKHLKCQDLKVNGQPWKNKDGDDCRAHRGRGGPCTGNGPYTPQYNTAWFKEQDTRSPQGYGALEVCCNCGGGIRTYK